MANPQAQQPAVAFFLTSVRLYEDPLSDEYFWDAYQDLALAVQQRGVAVYFASDNTTYAGNGIFTTAQYLTEKVPHPKHMKRAKNVAVQLVMERSEPDPFRGNDVPVFNSEYLRNIINNKIGIYQHFGQYQPQTHIVESEPELHRAIDGITGDRVVVKIPDGFGGKGVHIGHKAQVKSQISHLDYPLVVQEFVDTSQGIPGRREGVHDVRIKVAGGNIIGYAVRWAEAGSYHSNISMGGTQENLPVEEIPEDLKQIVEEIDTRLHPHPRYYSSDFVHTPDGWKLIELNDYLGLSAAVDGEQAQLAINRLADYIADLVRSNQTER